MADNKVLQYFREKDPRFQSVDDSTLTQYIVEKYPDFAGELGGGQPSVDIEALKQKSLQRALYPERTTQANVESTLPPALRPIASAFLSPLTNAITANHQINAGNPLGGGLGAANAAVQSAFAPVTAATEAVRLIPGIGNPIANAAGVIPNLVGSTGKALLAPLGKLIPESWQGQTPEQRDYTKQQAGEAVGNVSMAAVPVVAEKVFGITEPIRQRVKVNAANDLLDQAFPATAREITRPEDRARMSGYIADEQRSNPINKRGRDDSAVRQIAKEKFPDIKDRIYKEQDAVIQRNKDIMIPTAPIADAVEGLRNIFTKNIDLLKDQSILDEAAKYRDMKEMSIVQAREMQKSINASLGEFYKKTDEGQVALENAAKPIAEMEKAADEIRNQIASALDAAEPNAGGWYADKSRDYGAAVRLEAAAERNITRAERPPVPFLNKPSSMHNPYASRANVLGGMLERTPLGKFVSPDALATRAFKKFADSPLKPNPPLPPPSFGVKEWKVDMRRTGRLGQASATEVGKNAAKVGLQYDGEQTGIGHQFTDVNGTGSTFYVIGNPTVEAIREALKKHREGFSGQGALGFP